MFGLDEMNIEEKGRRGLGIGGMLDGFDEKEGLD